MWCCDVVRRSAVWCDVMVTFILPFTRGPSSGLPVWPYFCWLGCFQLALMLRSRWLVRMVCMAEGTEASAVSELSEAPLFPSPKSTSKHMLMPETYHFSSLLTTDSRADLLRQSMERSRGLCQSGCRAGSSVSDVNARRVARRKSPHEICQVDWVR